MMFHIHIMAGSGNVVFGMPLFAIGGFVLSDIRTKNGYILNPTLENLRGAL